MNSSPSFKIISIILLINISYSCKHEDHTKNLSIKCDPKVVVHGSSFENTPSPNIIVIMIDDLGKEWLDIYGADDIFLPYINSLAREGMVFHNVYSMPVCMPSRVTLLTGRYPYNHRWMYQTVVPNSIKGLPNFLPGSYEMFPRTLRNNGYRTLMVGKWQINNFAQSTEVLKESGFDKYLAWETIDSETGIRTSRYFDPLLFENDSIAYRTGSFSEDLFIIKIKDFIKENVDGPFMIYYPMTLTHTPFIKPPSGVALTDYDKHKEMVKYMDRQVGHVVNYLDSLQIRDQTLVILTSDNGTTPLITGSIGGKALKGGKPKLSQSGINVPFIVSWPGYVPSSSQSHALIDFTDIYPTILDFAGIDYSSFNLDGYSQKNVFLGRQETVREVAISCGAFQPEDESCDISKDNCELPCALIWKNYKLKVLGSTPIEFYNLLRDPYEESNIINELSVTDRYNLQEMISCLN